MAIVVRLHIYEGSETALAHQLGRALNDGVKLIPGAEMQITTLTLPAYVLRVLADLHTALKDLPLLGAVGGCRVCEGRGYLEQGEGLVSTSCEACGGSGVVRADGTGVPR